MLLTSDDITRRARRWSNGMTFREPGGFARRRGRQRDEQPCDERGERDDLEHRRDADRGRDRAAERRADDAADREAHPAVEARAGGDQTTEAAAAVDRDAGAHDGWESDERDGGDDRQ